MLTGLRKLQEEYPHIGDVRGKGLVMGLEFVDPQDGYTPSPEITRQIIMGCAENGLLLGKVGLYGNVIRIAPPLVITQKETDLALDILDAVMARVAAD